MADTFKEFVTKWTTPSVLISLLLLILGGIVWGVQLNTAILKLTEAQSADNAMIKDIREEASNTAVVLARTAAVVESVALQVDRLERRMTRNEGNIADNLRSNHNHGE